MSSIFLAIAVGAVQEENDRLRARVEELEAECQETAETLMHRIRRQDGIIDSLKRAVVRKHRYHQGTKRALAKVIQENTETAAERDRRIVRARVPEDYFHHHSHIISVKGDGGPVRPHRPSAARASFSRAGSRCAARSDLAARS